MTKRPFQILDEMNQEDVEKWTQLVRISTSFIRWDLVKQWAKIEMWIDAQSFHDLMNDKVIPMLVFIDKETYFKNDK